METNNKNAPIVANESLWQGLKSAIRGTEADYTQIDLKKAIFLLAIPMILELVMESTFALVDIFFVGKLGASAVASVGLTETYLFLIYAIAMGLSTAITAIMARRIGEKKQSEAGLTAVQSILVGFLVSLPLAVLGLFYSKELLGLMGADEWTLTYGYKYMQWMVGGNLIIMLLFIINAIFRGAGDAAIAMKVLLVANALNILLDPLFIFGWGPVPAFGIQGAAIATNIGRGLAVLLQFYLLLKGGKHIRVLKSHFVIQTQIILNIIRTSLGGIGQMIIGMTAWIFLMRILADIGSEAVAGATIALRIMLFTLMPAWGMANAAATLVGQNLGAGHPERAEHAIWKTGIYNMFFLIGVSVIYFIFNEDLVRFFSQDARVVQVGSDWVRILSYSYFIYGWWMVSSQAFNGSGDTMTPTKINFVFFWLLQIPLSYYLALEMNWQHSGVFWGVFVSETLAGIFTVWLFKRGKWKLSKV